MIMIRHKEAEVKAEKEAEITGMVEESKYILLTKRQVKMAGYWPSSLFAFLWTETKSRSIKTQNENSANTQPS